MKDDEIAATTERSSLVTELLAQAIIIKYDSFDQ